MKRIVASVLLVFGMGLGQVPAASAQEVQNPTLDKRIKKLGSKRAAPAASDHEQSQKVTDAKRKELEKISADEEDRMRDPAEQERREFEERGARANGIEPPNH